MDTTPQVAAEPQAPRTSPPTQVASASEASPFATCRICDGAIGRSEQVYFFPRSKTVAHLRCWS